MFSVRRSKSRQQSTRANGVPEQQSSSGIVGERRSIRFTDGTNLVMSSSRDLSGDLSGSVDLSPPPILSILIPALISRPWELVWSELCRQVKFFNQDHDREMVEVLLESDNGEMTSGEKRNLLVSKSKGRYRCFVDDDDEVTPTYVSCLVEGCLSGADVVSFNVKVTDKSPVKIHPPVVSRHRSRGRDILLRRTDELWRLGLYPHHRPQGMMTANHLCAWKKDIADLVAWDPVLGYGDDQLWYKPLYLSGQVKTCWHINRVLYHYLYNSETSANQKEDKTNIARSYVRGGLHVYRTQGGEILLQTRKDGYIPPNRIWVRNRDNAVITVDPRELHMIGTVTLD